MLYLTCTYFEKGNKETIINNYTLLSIPCYNLLKYIHINQSYYMYLKKKEMILVPITGSGPAWMTWSTTSALLYR
jgi:hypothetical protein